MERSMQKSSRKSRNSITPPTQQSFPAVSVIIPMYNAEKYITECLDSILAQTFTNFEVIVVDDCSTDNSVAIVESYKEKFGGRLKLFSTEFNADTSGSAPRNKGMLFSRGEYVTFVDADDLLKNFALKEMYTLAKDFDADVVHCEKAEGVDEDLTNPTIRSEQNSDFVDKPTLETMDLEERVQKLLQRKFWVGPVSKLVRRDFLLKHEIFFPPLRPREDDIWSYGLIFHAKKFLRIPNIVYMVRRSANSVTRKNRTATQYINFWLSPIFIGLNAIDKLINKFDLFNKKPQYRYALFEFFLTRAFSVIFRHSVQLPPFAVYEAIKQEFGDKLGEQDVLVSALCAFINTQQRISAINQQKFNEFAAQSQKELQASKQKFKELAEQVQQVIDELELKTK